MSCAHGREGPTVSLLPLDELKIDQIFVSGVDVDQRQRGLVAGIIAMSTALDLRVVAEGIETEDQRDIIVGLGCALGQGYLFGAPADGEHAAALVAAEAESGTVES